MSQKATHILFALVFYNVYLFYDHFRINQAFLSKRATSIARKARDSVEKTAGVEDVAAALTAKPFVFVGGYPRSGTTLMRAILDVHPQVVCGPETRILPLFLELITSAMSNATLLNDMNERYITNTTIHSATSLFVGHIVQNRALAKAERPCVKDPLNLMHIAFLRQLFPNARFVYMVRDARAVVYSYMNRMFPQAKGDFSRGPQSKQLVNEMLLDWEHKNARMHRQCEQVGAERCHVVKYEELVERPETTLLSVTRFLNLTWSNNFLRHDTHVGKDVLLNDSEWTRNVNEPINNRSLNAWIDKIAFDTDTLAQLTMQKLFAYA